MNKQIIDLEEAISDSLQEVAQVSSATNNPRVDDMKPAQEPVAPVDENFRHQANAKLSQGTKSIQPEPPSVPTMPLCNSEGNSRNDEVESRDEIYIANAGLVLLSSYIPQFFNMLGLTEGAKFKDEKAAERAIHLLQFVVSESCDSPEFKLALNKIMCGVATGVPIIREIELLPMEKEVVAGMLTGIIKIWSTIGNTSVQELRESFLQRTGRLQLKEDCWHLKVEPKGIDVLLDRLPWSFSIIKHPWMTRTIYVEWR